MNYLFKELTDNCKVIYDNDNFSYLKCDDIESYFQKVMLDIGVEYYVSNKSAKAALKNKLKATYSGINTDGQNIFDSHICKGGWIWDYAAVV